MRGRCPGIVAVLVILIAIAAGTPAAWADDSADAGQQVVAAYTTVKGSVRPDPGVSVAASKKKLYDMAESYIWAAIPPDCRPLVSRLELFATQTSAEDAVDGTATPNDDGSRWTLSFDWGEAESAVVERNADDEAVFDEVIAHELGHILSLKSDQFTDDDSRGTYSDSDGTFRKSAYLNAFYQDFWKDRYPGWTDKDGDQEQAAALYGAHAQAFVTEYAATDPSEDFAESFASFVLQTKPIAATERSKKIRFFYAYPELVKDRDFLRQNLDSAN